MEWDEQFSAPFLKTYSLTIENKQIQKVYPVVMPTTIQPDPTRPKTDQKLNQHKESFIDHAN